MSKLRVMVVDDDDLFREGLSTLLAVKAGFEVVGEANNGAKAVELARHTKPDVILMDLRMPEMDGVQATKQIKTEHPKTGVVALTTFGDEDNVFAALKAGAVGYLLKATSLEKIGEAIRLAARKESLVEQSVVTKLVAGFARLANRERSTAKPVALLEPLTNREQEVLFCLTEGLSNKEISQRLGISDGTVKAHLTNIFGKLGVSDRTQAALRARELEFSGSITVT